MTRPSRTVLAVIDSLGGGGAEGVLATLTNQWAAAGDRVHIALLSPEVPHRYSLHPDIATYPLGSGGGRNWPALILRNARRARQLRTIIGRLKPDVIVSFMPSATLVCILAGGGDRLVASERCMPELHSSKMRLVMRLAYPHCRLLVCVSRRVSEAFGWFPAGRRRVIWNPVAARVPGDSTQVPIRPFIVAVGRLDIVKRFDVLIRAFARVAKRIPEVDLVICGEGGERDRLESVVREEGVTGRVHLPGWRDDVQAYIARSEFLVLSSQSEGLPNVLIEAMHLGKAVIATDCGGVTDIVTDDVDGLLVPVNDVPALANAIARLHRDRELRSRLEREGLRSAARFMPQKIASEWESVFAEVTP
jgi:glycosyltransferase involved in cell wall biosynthesis